MSAETRQTLGAGYETQSMSVKVWDLFVRVFHWLLVIMFAVAWYSGGIWDQPHLAAGYFVLALIVARIVWGFVGSQHARFSDFICGPRTIVLYIAPYRKNADRWRQPVWRIGARPPKAE